MSAPLPVVACCAPLGAPTMSDAEAEQLEQVFRALADRHRIKVINRLLAAHGEAVCVCDLQDLLDLKQSNLSYHLKQLLDAGLIDREKRGRFAYYSLSRSALEQVRALLELPARGNRVTRASARGAHRGERALGRIASTTTRP